MDETGPKQKISLSVSERVALSFICCSVLVHCHTIVLGGGYNPTYKLLML